MANSKIDGRIQQLDFQTHSLMQDMKKVGPNLKDVRLKLNRNWIPVWLKKPTDFRPTTKMPNFRLTDHQIQAISAYIWQAGFTDALPKQKPGNAEHGKELFETRGCLACHSIGEGDQTAGRNVRRESDSRGREGQLRLPGPLDSQCARAHASLLPVREEGHRPRGLRQEGTALPVRSAAQPVPQRRSRTASAEHDGDAQPAPERRKTRRTSPPTCMAQKKQEPSAYAAGFLHGRSRAEGGRQEVDSALRLRRMPRDFRLRGRRPHRHRADLRRQQADRASRFRSVHRNCAARRQESEPITDPEDLARLPEGPAKEPWYDHKGFFEHKLAEPNVYDKGKVKSETEALRMPNLHLSKEQIQDLTTFLLGSEESSLPAELPVQARRRPARHSGRLVGGQEVQLHGLPPVHARTRARS